MNLAAEFLAACERTKPYNARHHLAAESMAGEGRLTVAAQVNGDVIRPPAASGLVLGCPSKP